MLSEGNYHVVATPRTCCRCGKEFRTHTKRYVCDVCRRPPKQQRDGLSGKPLSPRELAVAEMIAEALANKEIAARLHLTEGTLKEYVHRIMRKLGLPNRVAVATWYLTRNKTEQ